MPGKRDQSKNDPSQPRPAPSSGAFSDPDRAAPRTGPRAIQAPWRLEYLEALGEQEKNSGKAPSKPKTSGSFLRDYWLDPAHDAQHHVIVRATDGLILLNAYPYATGHLLVALGEARPTLLDYSPEQRSSLWRMTDCAAALVQAAFEPQGLNIGVNQGRAAGAGVPGHLHVHIVPRWGGDVNFITAIGEVRVIPASLEKTAERYRKAWATIREAWM